MFRDFVTYDAFRRLRNQKNKASPDGLDYTVILQNKLLFDRFYRPSGIAIPSLITHCTDMTIANALNLVRNAVQESATDSHGPIQVFFKPATGIRGQNCFSVTIDKATHAFRARETLTPSTFLKGTWLVQHAIQQHPAVARLHPPSVNTIRIITYRSAAGGIEVFLAYLRMGAAGSIVDNASAGGTVVAVDLASGCLAEEGYSIVQEDAKVLDEHPSTHIPFKEIIVPEIEHARLTAIRAHTALPGVHTVGWDIAISVDGPILIEGNDDWGGVSTMWLLPDFRGQLQAMLHADDPRCPVDGGLDLHTVGTRP